jgi:starvation-inducible DNA-binding protein
MEKEQQMTELAAALKVTLANVFVMYFKTHSFHWNTEGIEFSQYHDFFGDLYDDVYGSVDPIAENLRKLEVYAPHSLMELYNHKTLMEENGIPDIQGMLRAALAANNEVIASLNKVFALATKENKQGLCNFIADRIDTHEKHGWQLRASLKG